MTPIRFIVFVGILLATGVFNGGCIGQRPTDSPENEVRLKALEMKVERLEQMAASTGNEQKLVWQQAKPYCAPSFESFFPDDVEGGKALDALMQSKDKDTRTDGEILRTVRNGLRRTKEHRTNVLQWIGNRYIWGKTLQNPDAIEIMYHAADFSGELADPYGTRHYAVYFGLSVVQPKTPAIIRTLVDLCMRVDDPNDLSRVAWGAGSQQKELIGYLQPYLESQDKAIRDKAEVCRKIFLGELEAFNWDKEQSKARAERQYANQLPEIKEALANGNSEKRKKTLLLIQKERISLIMDDSFISVLAACGKDEDYAVRNQIAQIVGGKWIWSAQSQNPEAIELMLSLSQDNNREVRYNAVYYGLSTIRNKNEKVIRRLLEMAFEDREPNLYGRIAWGLKTDRKSVAEILEGYINGTNPELARHAREVTKDMTGISTAISEVSAKKSDQASTSPESLDIKKMELEVETHYAKAHPEIKEYVIWTAKSFGPSGMWLKEDAFAALSANAREEKIKYLATLLEDSEYGRLLCGRLAEASALKDKRLLPGLIKVAGYQRDNADYDCRPKWMAVAALARQESDEAVPLLVSLVDHGNQNTRNWARAALSRKTGQDFKQDKQAWAKWWQEQGNKSIDDQLLKPWVMPAQDKK